MPCRQVYSLTHTYTHVHTHHRGSTAKEAAQNIIDVQIPAIHELCATSSLTVDNIDVFCEKGVFDTDTSCRILKAGKEAGWKLNFHGDELHPMNSGEVWYSPIPVAMAMTLLVHKIWAEAWERG